MPSISFRRSVRVHALLALVLVALVAALSADSSSASYPGGNGKLIYENYPTLGNPSKGPFTVSPNNPGSARMLTKVGAEANNYEYSPNGKYIAFDASIPDSTIVVMTANGKKAWPITNKVKACNGETFPTWAPNGKQIAFRCARSQGFIEFDIYSIKIAKKTVRKGKRKRKRTILVGKGLKRVTDTTHAYHPFWSPKGDRIAYMTSGNSIEMVPAGGGVEREVSPSDAEGVGGGWTALDWSPDGSRFAVAGLNGVYLMNPENGALIGVGPFIPDVTDPVFSPDGRELAYTTLTGASSPDIGAMTLGTGAQRLITTGAGSERTPSWQPLR